MGPAGEGQSNLLAAVGLEVGLRDWLALAALFQAAVVNLSARMDAGGWRARPTPRCSSARSTGSDPAANRRRIG